MPLTLQKEPAKWIQQRCFLKRGSQEEIKVVDSSKTEEHFQYSFFLKVCWKRIFDSFTIHKVPKVFGKKKNIIIHAVTIILWRTNNVSSRFQRQWKTDHQKVKEKKWKYCIHVPNWLSITFLQTVSEIELQNRYFLPVGRYSIFIVRKGFSNLYCAEWKNINKVAKVFKGSKKGHEANKGIFKGYFWTIKLQSKSHKKNNF